LAPGTLYAAIARLEAAGLVEGMEAADRRRPDRLSAVGRLALSEEIEAAANFARLGRGRPKGVIA
jgi:DNA-binding PadR family transcriptional regulator